MAEIAHGLFGCFRCAYVWRASRPRVPRICPRCKSRLWDVPLLRPIRRGTRQGIAQVVGPHRNAVLRAARTRGFSHVRIFGSVRRAEASPTSDVDLLVDRSPESTLLDRSALVADLEALLGRRVDVVPEEALHWLARPQVLFEAVPL